MAIRPYKCDACGAEYDRDEAFNEAPATKCEVCGEPTARRMIGRTFVTFDNSGWAEDGYQNPHKILKGKKS